MDRIVGYYVYWNMLSNSASMVQDGVDFKVANQIHALDRGMITCTLMTYKRFESNIGKAIISLPLMCDGNNWPDPRLFEDANFLYLRRPRFISRDMIRWFHNLKSYNDSKILLEIPTFPYDKEMQSPILYPALLKDRYNRKKLAGCVDRIVSMALDEYIFDIPNIHISNGIDLTAVTERSPITSQGALSMLCVASFAEWHGVDRILCGMADYKRSRGGREVRLHLVGDGPALPKLQRIAKELSLEDSVIFHGRMSQREFAPLYDRCDLAIECLGIHRKGIAVSSSLKSREYLAKGIPFVYSGEIDVFMDDPVDFCLRVPADESPVDVQALIDFRDALYSRETPAALTGRIRAYAEGHVSMDAAMRPVVDYLREACAGQ